MSAEFEAACAAACPHCAAGNPARHRADTGEWVHDYAARDRAIDTPALASVGGPARLMPGTFSHVVCAASGLRNRETP